MEMEASHVISPACLPVCLPHTSLLPSAACERSLGLHPPCSPVAHDPVPSPPAPTADRGRERPGRYQPTYLIFLSDSILLNE